MHYMETLLSLKIGLKVTFDKLRTYLLIIGLKKSNEIGDEVYNKANLLCEYKIIRSAFKNIRNLVKEVQAKFISKKRNVFVFNLYRTIENKNVFFFYDILLCRKI